MNDNNIGGKDQEYSEELDRLIGNEPPEVKNSMAKPIKLSELMVKQFEGCSWIVDKLVPAGGIIAISAAPASYKTWLILNLSAVVVKGDLLFGQFQTKTTGVLIIDEENGERLLQQRLHNLLTDFDLPIHILSLNNFKVTDPKNKDIIRYMKENSLGLIIFDSLIRIHNQDENDAGKMSHVFESLKQFNKAGITVIFTHHNRKQGNFRGNPSQEMRGSSDILASVDCHISIDRKDNQLTITQTKLRQDEELRPFKVNIVKNDDGFLIFNYDEEVGEIMGKLDQAKEKIIELLGQGNKSYFKKEITDTILRSGADIGTRTINSAIDELVVDGHLSHLKGSEKNKTFYSLMTTGSEEINQNGKKPTPI